VIVCEHTTPLSAARRARTLRAKALPLLIRLTYPRADAVIAVSQGVSEDLRRVLNDDVREIKVIYNPVLTPRVMAQSMEEVQDPWLEEGSPPIVLGIGRLVPPKDFPTLIRAFARVRQRHECRLMILGEGPLRAELEGLIGELGLAPVVRLPGFAHNPYPYLRRAAVFVLSSVWEGLPTVLIEALACGTPVVSTDCPSGPREILVGPLRDNLVPVGNIDAMADRIMHWLTHPELRVAPDPEFLGRFSPEQAFGEYMDQIRSVR
jgi:glycosyltransferase involved in cell wall biosynthesis